MWKDFQSVKPLENEKTHSQLWWVDSLTKKKERSLFILIGTVGHRKQKPKGSHSPIWNPPEKPIFILYILLPLKSDWEIKSRSIFGEEFESRELKLKKKTTNAPFYPLFLRSETGK